MTTAIQTSTLQLQIADLLKSLQRWMKTKGPKFWAAVGVVLFLLNLKRKQRRRSGEPPLESGVLPFVGLGFECASSYGSMMDRLRKKHGGVFTIINFGMRMHFISKAPDIKKVWARPNWFNFIEFSHAIDAHIAGLPVQDVLDSGADSDKLAEKASAMRTPEALDDLAVRFSAGLDVLAEMPEFKVGFSRSGDLLTEFCGPVVWYAAGRSLYGSKWLEGCDLFESYSKYHAFEDVVPKMVGNVPDFLIKDGVAARNWLAEHVLSKAVHHVVHDPDNDHHEYLSDYVKLIYNGHGKSEAVAGRRLTGLLNAIMTNTTYTLFWTIAHLNAEDPSVRQLILDETKTLVSSLQSGKARYMQAKNEMPNLMAFILEVMRFRSDPVSFRIAVENSSMNFEGKDYKFRKGDSVFLVSGPENVNADLYDEPHKFKAKRFLDQANDPSLQDQLFPTTGKQHIAPFGGGKNLCPGRYFAVLEMQITVAWCLGNFNFDFMAGSGPGAMPAGKKDLGAPMNLPTPCKVRVSRSVPEGTCPVTGAR